MMVLAAAELLLIAGLIWFIGVRERDHARALLNLVSSQEAERQLLLDRIEQPGTVIAPARTVEQPSPQPDEYELLRREYEKEAPNGR